MSKEKKEQTEQEKIVRELYHHEMTIPQAVEFLNAYTDKKHIELKDTFKRLLNSTVEDLPQSSKEHIVNYWRNKAGL